MTRVCLAALLAVSAGAAVAMAQPTVDGQRSADAQYVQRWLQNQPTSFGDNRADLCLSIGAGVRIALNNINGAGVDGDPNNGANSGAGVTTGIEIAIPLAQLGNPVGPIRISGFINGGGYDYLSNQVIGGLPAGQGNLGGDGTGAYIGGASPLGLINFNSFAGNQYVQVTNTSGTNIGAVTVDGTADAAYGAALWTSVNGTGFGNAAGGTVDAAGGSEIDGLYAKVATVSVDGGAPGPYLIVVATGNIETNFNKFNLFIDTGAAGGQNTLSNSNPSAEGLNTMNGLTFDAAFSANFYISVRAGGGPVTMYADFAKLNTGNTATGGGGGYLGSANPSAAVVGTGSACPPNDSVAVGSELDGIYSYLDRATRKLYVFASGNVKQDDFLHMFFDLNGNPAGNKGQNAIGRSGTDNSLVDNVQIGIPDHLHKFGADSTNPGLTFETNFFADYWMGAHFENVTRMSLDSAVLRNDGLQFYPTTSIPLDYGAYSAAEVNLIVPNDGSSASGGPTATPPGINLQDGSVPNIFSGFAPRRSNTTLNAFLTSRGATPFTPAPTQAEWETYITANPVTPGLLRSSYRNNNVVGVTDLSGTGAGAVTTGFEFVLDLAELGWTKPLRTNIKLVGFVANSSTTTISNQITGGSGQTANLGDPKVLNLQTLAGTQTITVGFCLADFNQSGIVSVQDIFDFLAAWFAKSATADVNGNPPGPGNANVTVQDIFDYLAAYFGGACS